MQANTFIKGGNCLLLLAFVLGALVQYNDPDPLAWIVIYSAASACCLLHLSGWPVGKAALTVALAGLGWALFLLPRISGETSLSEIFASITMRTQAVEEAREIGGLLLISGWMLVLWRFPPPARSLNTPDP